jgi:hypothetical protein
VRLAAVLLAAALVVTGTPVAGAQSSGVDWVRVACSLPHDQLLRVWRGTDLPRSGDILVVPDEPNFLGSNFPHSGPWDYLQDVPLFWYGPGQIPALGRLQRSATLADIAPTQAALLGFDGFDAPDGRRLSPVARGAASEPPALIVTLVWDGGGRNVLEEFPRSWPVLRSLIPRGIWYEHAEVGSSPSITPAAHATIGAGAFPRITGQIDSEFRLGSRLVRSGSLGPALLPAPTLADVYDLAMGNRPLVGTMASVTWHVNMMGHGAMFSGGDRDLVVLRLASGDGNEGAEGDSWTIKGKNAPWFSFPRYANDLPGPEAYVDELDREDGAFDGRWRDHDIAQLGDGFDTPARAEFQNRLWIEVLRREGFGRDDVPDLLFLNNKIIDHVGHLFSLNSPEMQDTVRWQDAALGELLEALDRLVGEGRWVIVLTADHGHQYDPSVSGAFQVTPVQVSADIDDAFGDGVAASVRTTQVYLDGDGLDRARASVDDVAAFLLRYTKAQGAPPSVTVPDGERDDLVFSAVFPVDVFRDPLPCLPEMEER